MLLSAQPGCSRCDSSNCSGLSKAHFADLRNAKPQRGALDANIQDSVIPRAWQGVVVNIKNPAKTFLSNKNKGRGC